MTKKELLAIKDLAGKVEQASFAHYLDPSLFQLTLRCLCRTPKVSYGKITEFIRSIGLLTDKGLDYTLLLKAGILAGQFPDYRQYKREKWKKIKKYHEDIKTQHELEELKGKLENDDAFIGQNSIFIPVNTKWVDRLVATFCSALRQGVEGESHRVVCQRYWRNHLTLEQRSIASAFSPEFGSEFGSDGRNFETARMSILDTIGRHEATEIQKRLNLDSQKWICFHQHCPDNHLYVVISKMTNDIRTIKVERDNPFDLPVTSSVAAHESYVVYDDYENEKLKFISIYQQHILGLHPEMYPIVQQLRRYFIETHGGREPRNNEIMALRQQFYRFIRKAYPREMLADDIFEDEGKYDAHVTTVYMPGVNSVFYLGRGMGAERNEASLRYDKKRRIFLLSRGSMLAQEKKPDKRSTRAKFIKKNTSTIRELPGGGYRVVKNTPVPSSSLAAWLACGYKRNGLNSWKNSRGQTLRKYLESIGHLANNKITPKFSSTQQEDLAGHQDDDSTTPTPR